MEMQMKNTEEKLADRTSAFSTLTKWSPRSKIMPYRRFAQLVSKARLLAL
jgi:hypothetical protein